ncbi:MAG: ABC transporter permease [Acidobacteria bacterium]|nr:ABC transporter permease [Acidobacteriota bacterium]
MDALFQDLRYAVRTLLKDPGFAGLSILCLALGVGVNSTIFSVVDTIAIRPLPFRAAEELVSLHTTHKGGGVDSGSVSFLDMQDWRARSHAFAEVAGMTNRSATLADGGGEPERLLGAAVTWNLFPMLGIEPILGRQFREEEDTPGGPPVVMLSHGVWQRRYASDPSIVGRTITVNSTPHTVVGVMPPRFQFPALAQLWIPLTPIEYKSTRANRIVGVFARLKPGATLAEARGDLGSIAAALAGEDPADQGWGATAVPIRDDFIPSDIRLVVLTMMGAVSLVLLIACANVANLLLSRATVRQREIAVRAALGAGRMRIVRQMLTESVLIALASAPLGVALAYIGVRWLTASIPPQSQVPYYIDWSINPRVLVYTGAIAALTGVIFGLAPALQAARTNLQGTLKDGGRGASVQKNRVRSALIVAEIALSLVLLVGASLFVRSFLNMQNARAGVDTSALMVMRFYMAGDQYEPEEAMVRRVDDIVRRVEALPGVASATASNMIPYEGGGNSSAVVPEGVAIAPGEEPRTSFFGVTPHAFKTLKVPIVAGRDFTDTDGVGKSPVAIVNGVLARRLWPNRSDVVGQRFRLLNAKELQWITVVGVIPDFELFSPNQPKPSSYAFLSYAHGPARNTGLTVRVAGGSPTAVANAARQEIQRSDPTLPVFSVQTGEAVRMISFWQYRLFGWMFSIFGVIALALASIGVYGVLSYAVSQRTQEIGVRMALGASRQDVFMLILAHGGRLAAIGIVCGVIGAAAVTRVVTSLLYNVTATDPLSFAGTAAFLALIALLASYVPARRATIVDPMVARRAE